MDRDKYKTVVVLFLMESDNRYHHQICRHRCKERIFQGNNCLLCNKIFKDQINYTLCSSCSSSRHLEPMGNSNSYCNNNNNNQSQQEELRSKLKELFSKDQRYIQVKSQQQIRYKSRKNMQKWCSSDKGKCRCTNSNNSNRDTCKHPKCKG